MNVLLCHVKLCPLPFSSWRNALNQTLLVPFCNKSYFSLTDLLSFFISLFFCFFLSFFLCPPLLLGSRLQRNGAPEHHNNNRGSCSRLAVQLHCAPSLPPLPLPQIVLCSAWWWVHPPTQNIPFMILYVVSLFFLKMIRSALSTVSVVLFCCILSWQVFGTTFIENPFNLTHCIFTRDALNAKMIGNI